MHQCSLEKGVSRENETFKCLRDAIEIQPFALQHCSCNNQRSFLLALLSGILNKGSRSETWIYQRHLRIDGSISLIYWGIVFEADVRGDSALLYAKVSAVFQGMKLLRCQINVTSFACLVWFRIWRSVRKTLSRKGEPVKTAFYCVPPSWKINTTGQQRLSCVKINIEKRVSFYCYCLRSNTVAVYVLNLSVARTRPK